MIANFGTHFFNIKLLLLTEKVNLVRFTGTLLALFVPKPFILALFQKSNYKLFGTLLKGDF